jgi:predicted transposase YbfD/YdcC
MQSIPDFRKARGQRYNLHNLLTISILAFLSGADDFEMIAAFAKRKQSFLQSVNLLDDKRLPSHDLFRWLFMHLDKSAFSQLLAAWLSESIDKTNISQLSEADLLKYASEPKKIQIDGKALRASRTSEHTKTALQVVSAFVSATHLTLEQVIIDAKSCEKTAIPQLLDLIDLKNSVVTIDAIATSKANAQKIVDKQGDYILALKKNNRLLFYEVENFFKNFSQTSLICDTFESFDQKHGRKEVRTCKIISQLNYFPDAQGWKNLKSLVCIESQRTSNDKITYEKRFYLSSLKPNAQSLAQLIRGHWAIENNLHWTLDVAFNEDLHRLKDKNAAFCCTAIRRFALALIKNAKISDDSVKSQRWQIALDDNLLVKYLHWL